jgi:hypothetical protein
MGIMTLAGDDAVRREEEINGDGDNDVGRAMMPR